MLLANLFLSAAVSVQPLAAPAATAGDVAGEKAPVAVASGDIGTAGQSQVAARGVSLPIPMDFMVQIPARDYCIGKYEVTQDQWSSVMGDNPSRFQSRNRPVESVSWDDIQVFIGKLNALPAVVEAGVQYRLPTADEWEHACRAGSTGKYGLLADGTEGGIYQMAWFWKNWRRTRNVGTKMPNAFGLYDMHGNVWEWTSTADGYARVYCGGSWCSSADDCAASSRDSSCPGYRSSRLGFRLLMEKR